MNAHNTPHLSFHIGEDASSGTVMTTAPLFRQHVAAEMSTLHARERIPEAEIEEQPPEQLSLFRRVVLRLLWWNK